MALTSEKVRLFIRDDVQYNNLIDEVEFKDDEINNYKSFSLQLFNLMPPISGFNEEGLPPNVEVIILYGTLAHMYGGRAAHAARNQMSYSDGGLTVPIEERYQYYADMSAKYHRLFQDTSKQWKIGNNMENGWGSVQSDFSTFPIW